MHIKSFAKSVEPDEPDEINFLKFQCTLSFYGWSIGYSLSRYFIERKFYQPIAPLSASQTHLFEAHLFHDDAYLYGT